MSARTAFIQAMQDGLRGIKVLWVGNGVALVLRLMQSIILARAAGAHEFGIYVAAVIFAGILARIVDLGLPTAGAHILRADPSRSSGFLLLGILHCVAAAPIIFAAWYLLALSPFIETDVGGLWGTYFALFSLLSLAQLANGLMSPMLVPLGRLRAYALASCLPPFTALCLGILVSITSQVTAITLVAIVALSELSGALLSGLLIATRFSLSPVFEAGQIRQIYAYGLRAQPGLILKTLSQRIDRIALVGILSPAALASYAIAISIRDQLATPITIHTMLVRNRLVDLLQTKADPKAARQYLDTELKQWIAGTVPLSLALALCAPWLVEFLYGSSFSDAGLPTAALVLTLGPLAAATFSWCVPLAGNKPTLYSVLTIASTLATCAASVVGALAYGVVGAAIGNLIIAALSAVAWFAAARIQLQQDISVRQHLQ